ncbi:MAG: SDR family oxidoreductase [Candidatus Limnocylindria bacterium]
MTDDTTFLLIGAAGLVGRHLREALAGRRVAATYHRTPAAGAMALDLADTDAVRRLVRRAHPDVVVLAAAETHVERCERERESTRQVNVTAARAVAEVVEDIGAALVVFSSEYVFDGTVGQYGEDDALGPINEYGRQKVELEAIAASAARHLICRSSGIYGWEDRRMNFVCRLVDHLRAGRRFDVPTDQIVTPTHAPALAEATVELIDGGHAGTFHVVGPRILGRLEFAEMAAAAFDLPGRLLRPRETGDLGLAAARPLRAGLRDDKLRAALGHGLTPPADGLRAMRATERR